MGCRASRPSERSFGATHTTKNRGAASRTDAGDGVDRPLALVASSAFSAVTARRPPSAGDLAVLLRRVEAPERRRRPRRRGSREPGADAAEGNNVVPSDMFLATRSPNKEQSVNSWSVGSSASEPGIEAVKRGDAVFIGLMAARPISTWRAPEEEMRALAEAASALRPSQALRA